MQGLFDSDGYVSLKKCGDDSEGCNFEWSTSSNQLSEDFAFLVRSLGCVDKVTLKIPYYIHNGEKRECKLSYRHHIKVPNNLQICTSEKHIAKIRKRQHEPMRKIVGICEDGFEECQCIMVDSPDHTYITDNVTVTHNTVIAKEIIAHTKERVLFIVPKLELIKQASSTFNEDVDIIWSSKTSLKGNHIIVASKQTLIHRNLSDYFHEPITVIVDEVHIGLQSLKSVLNGVDVKRIIGLTATPERNDGSSFVLKEYASEKFDKDKIYQYAVFERVINEWNIQELQKLGYLSKINMILNPNAEKLKDVKPKHTYDDELSSEIIMSSMGDDFFKFIHKAVEFKGKPTIVFTPDLQSLDIIMKTLNKSGLNYKHVDGGMSVEEREVILNDLEKGRIDGVVNCGVLTTGFDMPCVKQCILIRNIKSRALFFQIVGRFIRPYNDETAEIYDFGGSSYNFATATNPNPFEKPVDWHYEGRIMKEKSDEEIREMNETEDLKDSLSEANISWTEYLQDPNGVLLKSLLYYKENFEKNLYLEQQKLKDDFDKTVDRKVEASVKHKEKQIKEEIVRNSRSIIEEEIKKKASFYGLDTMKNWFSINAFEWFRGNLPRILKENKYNYAKEYVEYSKEVADCNNADNFYKIEEKHKDMLRVLKSIKEDVIDELPFNDFAKILETDNEVNSYFERVYAERTNWWFSKFTLNYER